MKAPRFWYPQPGDALWPSFFLSPLSYLFQASAAARRAFAQPYRPFTPLICVGNAVAGGAGKTPTALKLAQIFKAQGHRPVFVTRGYGGSLTAKETVCIAASHQAEEVGDEALLLAAHAPTWAGRDRVAAIRQAEKNGSVIIMDDGLQNPHITPWSSLLVVDGAAGVGNGRLIPAGPLRENLSAALARATAVVMIGLDKQNLAASIKIPVLQAGLQPRPPPGFPKTGPFVAFAGIGRPEKFYATARALGLDVATTVDFPDHHLYNDSDINALRLRAEEKGARLLTTEKDAVRLPPGFRDEPVILPVELVFEDSSVENHLARMLLGRSYK